MKCTEALIEKFFRNECNEEQKNVVWEYFLRHPERLRKYLTEESWTNFQTGKMPPSLISGRMLRMIENNINADQPEKKPRVISSIRPIYLRWAAVAALLLIILSVWKWGLPGRMDNDRRGNQTAVPTETVHRWKEKMNHTGRTIRLSLPDSSSVELADQSGIRYEDGFSPTGRNIYLKGRALFSVKKDPLRPFTVHAAGFSTTALGTVFRVTAYPDSAGMTDISLLSGKVVIRPDSLLHSKGVRETYLNPGQQLCFDALKLTVSVHQIERAGSATTIAASSVPGKIVRFNNTLLEDLFNTLEKETHCRFIYDRKTVHAIRFTGIYNSNRESLKDFLNTIALLNTLIITQKQNTFYIK